MKTLVRFATITVASAALVAGGATAATAAPGDGVAVTTVQLKAGSTYQKSNSLIPGNIAVSIPANISLSSVKATVTVNGKPVANGVSIGSNGFYYQRAWGIGTVRLTNFTVAGYDYRAGNTGAYNRAVPAPANSARVRYALESRRALYVSKRGKKMSFKITATYRDKAGKRKSARKATVQIKKSGKWKTLKNVKLNSKGQASFKRKDGKKRTYRVVIKTTNTIAGGSTKGLKI